MMREIPGACLAAGLTITAAFAQAPPQTPSLGASSRADRHGPEAYVYVSAAIADSNSAEIYAYAAAPSGKLTPVSGSPYPYNVTYIAANGTYLFGSDASGTYIHAYSIDSDGALRYAASTNVVQPGSACDSPGALFLDLASETLYNVDYYGSDCTNAAYQAFAVDRSTGDLTLVHEANDGPNASVLRFNASNTVAIGADCAKSRPAIYSYRRARDGSLTKIAAAPTFPPAVQDGVWCPYLVAADHANHIIVPMVPSSGYMQHDGPYQLATYTLGANGTLSTASTYENMPKLAVGDLTDIRTAPSGKFLAVAGANGLQMFQIDGGGTLTPYARLLTSEEVDQMFWDNRDHLYAISQSAGKLWGFTLASSGFTQSPGSPYSIPGAQNVAVQPLPFPSK